MDSLKSYEIYKKWRQGKGGGGFAGFSNWMLGEKIVIDIGDTDNGLKSHSVCYVDTIAFLAYLHAEVNDTVAKLYPEIASNYGMQIFGGSRDVARVFTVKAVEGKPGTRWFKCGEYIPQEITAQGAIQPDYSQKINENSIQMKPFEVAQLYQAVLLSQQAFENLWMADGRTRERFITEHAEILRVERANAKK